jgi:hypothetical protein
MQNVLRPTCLVFLFSLKKVEESWIDSRELLFLYFLKFRLLGVLTWSEQGLHTSSHNNCDLYRQI